MTNRWWIYQKERFPIFAHGPLIIVFCTAVMFFSALQQDQFMLPDLVRICGAVITRPAQTTATGDLYASVTLPNIMVGTVGGGTTLPSARACLDILGLAGCGNSTALAEVCAGLVLAGELSIIGAFCSGDFAMAHRSLSRGEPMNRGEHHD